MKFRYDKEVDIAYIRFSEKVVSESEETNPGIIIDFDDEGEVVGIEILDASKRTDSPHKIDLEVA